MSKTQTKKDKIDEALALLNNAAHEKKDEVRDAINVKYTHVRDMFAGAAEQGKTVIQKAKNKAMKTLYTGERKVKASAMQIDKKVHKNPWAYVGGAALGSLFMGMIWGRRK